MNGKRLFQSDVPFRFLRLWIFAMASASTLAEETEEYVSARSVHTFTIDRGEPLRLPTAVDVGPDGHVYVADGVHDRIVVFSADGRVSEVISHIGSEHLSNPVSIKVDSEGRLWIADTGNARILARGADGNIERIIEMPREGVGHRLDVTDLAVSADGTRVWMVDNDNHRIALYDLETSSWRRFLPEVSEGDIWYFPFMAALSEDGRLYVTDVASGRARSIVAPATLGRWIGRYGVEPGRLYRPKGIACDDAGNVWISDSVMGVVQVFTGDGKLRSVVRDTEGNVLKLQTPCGLAWHREHLYVVEMIAGRVRKFEIGHARRPVQPPPTQPAPRRMPQPQQCTICHIDWLSPFDQGISTELMDVPVSTRELPHAGRWEICLSCHDGSVVDSRRRVWLEHGHTTGTMPPETMHVPRDLPLVNGRLDCRTCHSAHTHGGAGQTMFDAVFLRVDHSPDELCMKCHTDKRGDLSDGFHPSGAVLTPLPEELVDFGARIGKGDRPAGCMVCHAVHGAAEVHLRLPTPGLNDLCLSCHQQLAPDTFGNDRLHSFHPLTIPSNRFERSLYSDTTDLDCSSCHRMHEAAKETPLLSIARSNSQLCLECHRDYHTLMGSVHDLRHSAPDERNIAGLRSTDSGPCSACHNVHSPARQLMPTALDRSGQCTTCHSPGECAESSSPATISHPMDVSLHNLSNTMEEPQVAAYAHNDGSMSCLVCHDPHRASQINPALLRGPDPADKTQLCAQCHTDEAAVAHSFHAPEFLRRFPQSDHACGPCHSTHGETVGTAGRFWTAPPGPRSDPLEIRLCTGCHRAEAGMKDIVFRLHPVLPMMPVGSGKNEAFLPLIRVEDETGLDERVGCTTCHLPHGQVLPSERTPRSLATWPAAQVHAAKPMLRPYTVPNACSACHGFDGLRRFLYFHRSSPAR